MCMCLCVCACVRVYACVYACVYVCACVAMNNFLGVQKIEPMRNLDKEL